MDTLPGIDRSLPPVPGIDHSLPPVFDAPLSALDDSRGATPALPIVPLPLPLPLPPSPPALIAPPPPPTKTRTGKRARAPDAGDVPSAGVALPQKRRRSFSYWSADELRRLLEATCMAGADFTRIAKLVRTRSVDMCRKQVRAVAERVVGRVRAGATVDDCVRTVLAHLRVPPPPPRTRTRAASTSVGASRKVAIQVVPGGTTDAAVVDALGRNPCVEVVLRASRSVWDVAAHLYAKWGHPLRLLAPDGSPLPVDDSVASLCAAYATPHAATVRLSYAVLSPALDGTVMGNPGGAGVAVGCKARAAAARACSTELPLSPPLPAHELPLAASPLPPILDMPSSRSLGQRTYAPRPRAAPDLHLPFEGGLPPSPPPLPSRALPPRPPALLEDCELDAASAPPPPVLPLLSAPALDLKSSGEELMGKWAARLQSLENDGKRENAHNDTCTTNPTPADTLPPIVVPTPAATLPHTDDAALPAIGRGDSVLLAARALASETGAIGENGSIGVQDFPQLSTSLFGNMFKMDSQPGGPGEAVPVAVTGTGSRLLSSDNALVMHDGDDSGASLPLLPPRIESGFADPSLNFSLLFGDGMVSVGRPENSGSVPS